MTESESWKNIHMRMYLYLWSPTLLPSMMLIFQRAREWEKRPPPPFTWSASFSSVNIDKMDTQELACSSEGLTSRVGIIATWALLFRPLLTRCLHFLSSPPWSTMTCWWYLLPGRWRLFLESPCRKFGLVISRQKETFFGQSTNSL